MDREGDLTRVDVDISFFREGLADFLTDSERLAAKKITMQSVLKRI